MTLYPTTLPFDDITLIINDIRGNSVGTDEAAFAKSIWELTGYALKSTLGEPAGAPLSVTATTPVSTLTVEEVVVFLEKLVSDAKSGTSLGGLVSEIPWSSIAQWGLTALLTKLQS